MDYQIVSSTNIEELERQVRKRMEEGYVLCQSFCVAATGEYGLLHFFQPIMKYNIEKETALEVIYAEQTEKDIS